MPKLVILLACFRPRLKSIFKVPVTIFFVPTTEVPKIVQLVFYVELLAISSMSEARSEHKVCFRTSFRHTKDF